MNLDWMNLCVMFLYRCTVLRAQMCFSLTPSWDADQVSDVSVSRSAPGPASVGPPLKQARDRSEHHIHDRSKVCVQEDVTVCDAQQVFIWSKIPVILWNISLLWFLCEYVLKCNLFLYFQHHYSSLQCHVIFRNQYNMLIYDQETFLIINI